MKTYIRLQQHRLANIGLILIEITEWMNEAKLNFISCGSILIRQIQNEGHNFMSEHFSFISMTLTCIYIKHIFRSLISKMFNDDSLTIYAAVWFCPKKKSQNHSSSVSRCNDRATDDVYILATWHCCTVITKPKEKTNWNEWRQAHTIKTEFKKKTQTTIKFIATHFTLFSRLDVKRLNETSWWASTALKMIFRLWRQMLLRT